MNRFHYLNEVYEAPNANGVINLMSTSHISKKNLKTEKQEYETGLKMNKILECAYGSYEGRNHIMHKTMNLPKHFTVSRNQESIGRLNMMRGSDASIYGKYVDTLDSQGQEAKDTQAYFFS